MTPTLLERHMASRSGSEPYRMLRSEQGHWMHADSRCEGWNQYQRCHHIEECQQMDEERGLVPAERGNPLALLDDINLDDILGHRLPVPQKRANGQHPWVYEFQQGGQTVVGVSIDGVNDAARALASKGETIREMWVRLEREDEENAYFLACAARYAISPEGVEICLDTAIRAKRQPKFTKMRAGGVAPNENWYEVGVAKAVRNAKEALLPEAVKQWLISQAQAVKGGRETRAIGQDPDEIYRRTPFARASSEQKLRLSSELQAMGIQPTTQNITARLGLATLPSGLTIGHILDSLSKPQRPENVTEDGEILDA